MVDCCVFVLLVDSISHLSLSHSGYRYLFDARTAALLVHPADDRATASTFQHDDSSYRLDGGLTGYHYIEKVQRHLSLLLVLRPAATSVAGIVLSALQSMRITLNVGSLLSTLRNLSRLLSILHPTPPLPTTLAVSAANKSCRRQLIARQVDSR